MIMSLKQKKITFKTRIKLNHNSDIHAEVTSSSSFLSPQTALFYTRLFIKFLDFEINLFSYTCIKKLHNHKGIF